MKQIVKQIVKQIAKERRATSRQLAGFERMPPGDWMVTVLLSVMAEL